MKYLFGPVPSRRLGLSLGVDLVPYKVCSFDCLYCELGRTTTHTRERREYVPTMAVLDELRHYFQEAGDSSCDYVTLSGSGEPTLHNNLADIVLGIKDITSRPLALLTNSSLMDDPAVRRAVQPVDVILPSLDAATPGVFKHLNRPVDQVHIKAIISGLSALREEFKGKIWLEILFCRGINDSDAEVEELTKAFQDLRPDKIQLNTVVRPGAYQEAQSVSLEFLQQVQKRWGERAEIIASFSSNQLNYSQQDSRQRIVNTLKRRPCTVQDLASSCAMVPAEVVKFLDLLKNEGTVRESVHEGVTFFLA
ncbi:MAG: radical SAM protein [Pseudomonadota bacterium]|nr:radical SAM protein [Pseudomonadota bacterium]